MLIVIRQDFDSDPTRLRETVGLTAGQSDAQSDGLTLAAEISWPARQRAGQTAFGVPWRPREHVRSSLL